MSNLFVVGRFVKGTSEPCPFCGSKLQIRKVEESGISVKRKVCVDCGEYDEVVGDDRRKRHGDKERDSTTESFEKGGNRGDKRGFKGTSRGS